MNVPDPDRALGLLHELGYRSAFRLDAWVECLVWFQDERWIGRGASRSEAVNDVLKHIFPSLAAQHLLLGAVGGTVEVSASSRSGSSQSMVQERQSSFAAGSLQGLPKPTPQGPVDIDEVVDDRDPEDVLADVGLLDELIDSKRPEMALMSPTRQRLSILSWICHARATQGGSGAHSRVVTAVTHIARKLTLLSKRWWPGSVLSLQLDATPHHVGRELDLPRTSWPRSWAEAAACAEERLREISLRDEEAGFDAFGWSDSAKLEPSALDSIRILHDMRVQLEQVGGPLDHKPPNRASEGIRRPVAEMRERQRGWAQHSRWIRLSTTDYVTWGALMGRLRWMSTQASRRDDELVKLLAPEYTPEASWFDQTRMDEESERKERLRSQVLRRATILKNVDLDAMLAWLFDAFGVLDSPAIVRQLAPFRRQILEINPDNFPDMSAERRQRLIEVQGQLADLSPDEVRPSARERILPLASAAVSYEAAPATHDPLSEVRASVLPHTQGETCIYVSVDDPGDDLEVIREKFQFETIRYIPADESGLANFRAAVSEANAKFLISATGFYSHLFDLDIIRQCRRSDTLHIRAHSGDEATITLALARQLGLKRTSTAL